MIIVVSCALMGQRKLVFIYSLSSRLAQPVGTRLAYTGISLYSPWTWSSKLELILAAISSERSLYQLVGQSGKLEMVLFSITNPLHRLNGEQPSGKILAWFASKLGRALLILSLCGEIVAYDVVSLFLLGFTSLVFCYLCIFVPCTPVHTYIKRKKNRQGASLPVPQKIFSAQVLIHHPRGKKTLYNTIVAFEPNVPMHTEQD